MEETGCESVGRTFSIKKLDSKPNSFTHDTVDNDFFDPLFSKRLLMFEIVRDLFCGSVSICMFFGIQSSRKERIA